MKQKKFSLGDIMRKLHEEHGSATPPANCSEAPPQSPSLAFVRDASPPLTDTPERPGEPIQELRRPAGRSAQSPPDYSRELRATGMSDPPKTDIVGDPAPISPLSGETYYRPPRSGDDEEEIEFDLFRYIGIILRRKNIVILITLLFAAFSLFQYLKSEKYYTSHARLLFKPEEKEITGEQVYRSYGDREKVFNTHLELLKSNTVLNLVSDNLGNKIRPNQIRQFLTIQQGQTNRDKNDIIELTYRNTSPELSRDVLNELSKTYIDYRLEVNSQEVTRLLYKFDVQINKLQKDLDEKEDDLRKFKEENRMVQLSDETNLTVTKLSDMELSLQQTQLALIESKEKFTALNSQIGKQDQTIIQSMTFKDPFRDRLTALELEYNFLSAENSPAHYKVKMIRQQIDKLKAAAVDSLSREAESKTLVKNPIRESLVQDLVNLTIEQSALEAKRIALEKVIERLNLDIMKLPSVEQRYAFLQRETESILQTLRLLKTKYEEAKIKRDAQETDIKILELAELPRIAISGVKPTTILIGLLIGLILGIALAFLLEYLDQSVKDPIDVERGLGLPLLGIVPLIETNKALVQKSADLEKKILEPFRSLRANLKHLASTYNAKTFMICSAVKGEGKTTLAANLAITFALDNKKTILIDADLRRSQMHNLFAIPKEIGLTDYLLGTKTVDEIVKKSVYEKLCLVTSGERPHNPAELVGTYKFDLLIKELRERADVIIFDSPALLPVSDGITMAPKMDACIMVFRTLWTPLKAAKQAKYQLTRIGCRILGGIFNGVSQSRAYYPYYYGYYGYYSYTKYTYDEDHKKPFSIRQLGLHIENFLKNKLRSLRYSIPRYLATTGSFTKHIARKKSFWMLLFLLLALTGFELWLATRPAPQTREEAGIAYLGVGGDGEANPAAPSAAYQDPIRKTEDKKQFLDTLRPYSLRWNSVQAAQEAREPTSVDKGLKEEPAIHDSRIMTQSESEVKANDSLAKPSSPRTLPEPIPYGLQDSVVRWLGARKSGSIAGYLSFYDSAGFNYPGGGFAEWSARAAGLLSETQNSGLILDSVWQGTVRQPFIETHARIFFVSGNDTTRIVTAMIWKNGTRGWRIVGEKER